MKSSKNLPKLSKEEEKAQKALLEHASEWKVAFQKNRALIHLDLSNNNLAEKECVLINEGLTHNHTILGIHMIGNEAATDALGFV